MNNNVVEKTLKSIDNIDRLSDLAAISIYNTSHEAIDKFDVMQEHATPEYVEGEFVQESLLTGVLIGAGIIGVAISAFLIIKKILESKAKGDPNAASNTVAGVNLLNPDEINKLFDGWNDKYFKNHPDLVAEDVPGADVGELGRYNGILLEAIRGFCDDATSIIDAVDTLSDDDMRKAIDDLNKQFDSNVNMDELVSKTGRVDKNTILQIKAEAEGISKTLREFDAQVTKCITEFRNKEKNNQNSGSDNEENKISEENIKLLEKALKAKANTAGAIMDNFRNKCLNGIAQALDAKVKEAEGQAKAQNNTETSAETENFDKREKTPETTEGTPKAEPAATGESEEKPDDYDPTQYIDKNRAEEAAARESTEEFGGDSSDDSAEQSTSEQPENAEKKNETPSAEETTVTPKTPNNQATALNNNDILKTVADKYFSGDVDVTKDTLEAFNAMPTTNIIRDYIRGGLNEYLASGSGSLKETIQKYYDFYNEIFKDANLDIHLPDAPDFSDELVSKIKHIWNIKGGHLPSTDFDRMIDAMLHNSEEPLNQIDESQLKMGSSEESSNKTNETSNTKLFTDEEEDKIVDAAYAVAGLDRKFRQEIYNAVTDDGFTEAAKKLYAKYADDANKLNQINTTLIAMAKSIGKESEVPALPTADATPTESETSAENQTPEQTETPSEVPTTEPQAPSYTAPGVVTDNEELKKIADDLGLPLGNFIEAYDKVKEGNADYTESQMLTTVFNNQIAFNQFTLPAINEAIAKEYDKCKQVADAVHAPFDVEPITIDEATFEKLYAYFDQKNKSVQNMETAKLIPGALADMVMDEMRSSEIISPEVSENTETETKTISVDDPAYMEKINEVFSKAPDNSKQNIMKSIKLAHGDLDTYLKKFYQRIDESNETPEQKAKLKNVRYNRIKTLADLVGYMGDLTAPVSPRRSS